jgi:hypothetical protein
MSVLKALPQRVSGRTAEHARRVRVAGLSAHIRIQGLLITKQEC